MTCGLLPLWTQLSQALDGTPNDSPVDSVRYTSFE
jgi:hypothetical protein